MRLGARGPVGSLADGHAAAGVHGATGRRSGDLGRRQRRERGPKGELRGADEVVRRASPFLNFFKFNCPLASHPQFGKSMEGARGRLLGRFRDLTAVTLN